MYILVLMQGKKLFECAGKVLPPQIDTHSAAGKSGDRVRSTRVAVFIPTAPHSLGTTNKLSNKQTADLANKHKIYFTEWSNYKSVNPHLDYPQLDYPHLH